MAPDWAAALAPVEPAIHQMGDFLRAEVAAGHSYLPAGDAVFAAFVRPMAHVRVLVVGQDPYPTPGHPMGLSFSVQPGVTPLPKSLANIFRELVNDVGVPRPTCGDLSPWADQGVMLLNRVLTVRPGTPATHRGKGWEQVTDAAIDALVARGGPLVAILWGKDAQS
ncbi:MAG: uracil-DNA glycosylase, partial [Micrococcales bacterium]|nr:uracil-DNA glycosylase [Micrococcales bacterium]